MRLTWRDGVATVFMVLVALVTMAVSGSWGWPLLGGYRTGALALFVLAQPICRTGGAAFWTSEAIKRPALVLHDPFILVAMVLGVGATVLVVLGLVLGTRAPFLALAGVMGVLWLIATIRHVAEAAPRLHPAS
ncbi:MAG TPA: hypothetical protein VE646_09360 [Actinomycetota bacterium]|jgi:hypothetical protein|nr:hypothetical protein [Actinomycetota bacterium]